MSSLRFPIKLEDHPMRRYNFTWQGKSLPKNVITKDYKISFFLKQLEKDNEHLLHTWNCKDFACASTDCFRMKKLLIHTDECIKHECDPCKNSLIICYHHAISCGDNQCPIKFCISLKEKIQYHEKFQDVLDRNHRFIERVINGQTCSKSNRISRKRKMIELAFSSSDSETDSD